MVLWVLLVLAFVMVLVPMAHLRNADRRTRLEVERAAALIAEERRRLEEEPARGLEPPDDHPGALAGGGGTAGEYRPREDPSPAPRRRPPVTEESLKRDFTAGRISVEQYERRLDELYRGRGR